MPDVLLFPGSNPGFRSAKFAQLKNAQRTLGIAVAEPAALPSKPLDVIEAAVAITVVEWDFQEFTIFFLHDATNSLPFSLLIYKSENEKVTDWAKRWRVQSTDFALVLSQAKCKFLNGLLTPEFPLAIREI